MRIIRFVETPDGGSRFDELDIPFPDPYVDEFGNTYQMTRAFSSNGVIVDLPQGLNQDWHVAPSRQIVIVLTGRLEVETTDGEVRRWGPGDMFMADDPAARDIARASSKARPSSSSFGSETPSIRSSGLGGRIDSDSQVDDEDLVRPYLAATRCERVHARFVDGIDRSHEARTEACR